MEYVATILVLAVIVGSVMTAAHRTRPRVVSATVAAVCRFVNVADEQECPPVGSAGDEGRADADHKAPGKFAKVLASPDPGCTEPVSGPREYVPADDFEAPHYTWTESYTCAPPDGSTETCTRTVNKYTAAGIGTLTGSWSCTQTEPPKPVTPPTTPATVPATAPDGDIELAGCSADQIVGPPVEISSGGEIRTPHVATCTGTDGSTRQCDRQISVFVINGVPDHVRNGSFTCSAPLTTDQKSAVDQGADADYILGDDECHAPTALTPEAAAAAEKAIPSTTDTTVDALMTSAQQDMRWVAGFTKTLTGRDPRLPGDRLSFAASLSEFQQALAVQEDPALAGALEQLAPWTSPPTPATSAPGGPRDLTFCRLWPLHLTLITLPTLVKWTLVFQDEWQTWTLKEQTSYDLGASIWTATGFAAWGAYEVARQQQAQARQALRVAIAGNVANAQEIAELQAAVEANAYDLARFARATATGLRNYFGRQSARVGPQPAVMADALHQMEAQIVQPAVDEHGFQMVNPLFPGVAAG